MAINANKPHLWKADIAASVDYYNDWFMSFAPEAYRSQRAEQTDRVEQTMSQTEDLRRISPDLLRENPLALQMLRMATAPPLARDRLIGLAYVTSNLVYSMEETIQHEPRVPPRMPEDQLQRELERLCEVIQGMIDPDICPWLETDEEPDREQTRRAASIFADRLCGMATDPIIRNAQEREQRQILREWLTVRDYEEIDSARVSDILLMEPGSFTFGCTVRVPVGDRTHNLPVDCIIQPHRSAVGDVPILIEIKSAGDYTNPNKRQKEEAQKARQLRERYGDDVRFILFLRGYFNSQYLGYEAAEGLDWVWEHRIEDLAQLDLAKGPSDDDGPDDGDRFGPGGTGSSDGSIDRGNLSVHESAVQYRPSPSRLSSALSRKEEQRLEIQKELDRQKSQTERNQLGQFATPTTLADEIVQAARGYLFDVKQIDFLEPAFGTGSFFSALLRNVEPGKLGRCQGYEIDLHYARPAQQLWSDTPLHLEIADFTLLPLPDSEADRYDLIATNPPYVRHHHLRTEDKDRLRAKAARVIGTPPSGLSGLYTYFIYLAHLWLRQGGVGAWLIPSEFMYVNYGSQLRDYLLNQVTLLRVHRFDPQRVQFDDALVSSSVVLFRKEKRERHQVLFTYGGSLAQPELSCHIPVDQVGRLAKWRNLYRGTSESTGKKGDVRLGDIFDIRRGIATGANHFFVMTPDQARQRGLPPEFLIPVLPSPRYLSAGEIGSKDGYMPDIEEQRLLLSCDLPGREIEERYPALWHYIQEGEQEGIHQRYLCRHRSPWYSQETREAAPILCSYMGRASNGSKPFRFFLNRSAAVAPNTYLNLYPKPGLRRLLDRQPDVLERILAALQRVGTDDLVSNGRTYGGGLHKMEPKELENVRIYLGELAQAIGSPAVQRSMFDSGDVDE